MCVFATLVVSAALTAAAATLPGGDRVTIADGVEMPLINMGGVMASYSNGTYSSNHTLWLELGGRGIDTALMYSDAVQREVGAAVKWGVSAGIPREEIFVATKVPCCPMTHNDSFTSWCEANPDKWNAKANVGHDFEMLGLEYVDLMLVHWACSTMEDTVATYKALQPLLKSGKAKAIGVSNFNATFLEAFLNEEEVMRHPPSINQCGYSIHGHGGNDPNTVTPLGRDTATRDMCRKHNVTYSAYSPLGGLTGIKLWNNTQVKAVAKVHGVSAAQVALRWVVQQGVPAVTASNKPAYDKSDLDIFGFELTEAEMIKLSSI